MTVLPDKIDIDINDMTLGEMVEAESYCGKSITPIISRADLPADVLMALATVVLRRTDPSFTYADSGKLKVGRFNEAAEEVGVDAEPDPTAAGITSPPPLTN